MVSGTIIPVGYTPPPPPLVVRSRSSPCDLLASARIGSLDRAAGGVPLMLVNGFRHIGCCSAAVRCPWDVHGRHGLSLECACASLVGILQTDGDACCCPGTNGIQIRLVAAFTGMSAILPLLVATRARMVGHACHFNAYQCAGVASNAFRASWYNLFECPLVVDTADVARSRTRE